MIYADNAATTKMSDAAIHTMITLMNESWGNPSSLYTHGQKAKEALEAARGEIAAVIGAEPREIFFTSGGSEADNQALRTAAERGTFDAFVLEYQYYLNDSTLSKNYQFIPFGYIHDNPLAVIESTDETAKRILSLFADYCEENGGELAKKDGFNTAPDGFTEMTAEYTGEELINAQKLYKENKDSKPIVCVFVADVSGSMVGEPINALKESLINSMQYINTENYIGFVSYSDIVTIELPIAQFDLTQQSLFKGTVESLQTNGTTATFDAVCVAMKMVEDKLTEVPDAKPMIFVLSDGETNEGHSLSDISDIISGLKIPIYTIGYNANIDALAQLSDINEGICINAGTDDITYQLKQLFNANM
ncbi:MAG: aminotransferase class V-fold PLP-dependent enzyme [Clostridia bacterium]|nr:aminotransferase class V-fold PLP-dependent enzyme [Clostridia bacterium]